MADDTDIGGPRGRFPETRWSAIRAARSEDETESRRGLDAIVGSYWKPVYKYIRIRWSRSNEDAKDLTQEFFVAFIGRDLLRSFDPSKARLRTFLRVCVDRLIQNEERARRRLKRGGDVQILSLDFDAAEWELSGMDPPDPADLEDYFEKEWVRSLFGMAVEELRRQCDESGKGTHFRLFEIYDLDDAPADGGRPSYAELAARFGLKATDVTNYLAYARREFRRVALDKLREMTGTDDEFRREARSLLGIDVE